MNIVYLSNFFNHHQKFLSDEFYRLTNGNYLFVETGEMPDEQAKLGYQKYIEPYVCHYTTDTREWIDSQIQAADVVIFGEAPIKLIKKRVSDNRLTFRDDERRYKSLVKYLKWPIYTKNSLVLNKGYLLCASAFAARDYMLSGMRLERCFKWGYFPEVKYYDNIEDLLSHKWSNTHGVVKLLWACRMIDWKHPEMAVLLAKKLKESGHIFDMDLIGRGDMEPKLVKMINEYNLQGCVHLLGPMNPVELRKHMEVADIFLLTSDKYEGWGATLNESMNSACAVIASHAIGSVPFLVENGKNGLIYHSCNLNEMFDKTVCLIEDAKQRNDLSKAAYYTMANEWNPKVAATNFVALANSILRGENNPIKQGPCSNAKKLTDNWL